MSSRDRPQISEADTTLLRRVMATDLAIEQEREAVLSEADVDRLASSLAVSRYPVTYTAFDGDHFAMTSVMRRHALDSGRIPANPESILGYKESVDHHDSKAGVLLDDLSVLRRCDELWIYTDLPPLPDSLSRLAEGVLIELNAFLLWRGGEASVTFVPLAPLLLGERNPKRNPLELTIKDLEETLDQRQFSQVSAFVSEASTTGQLRPVAFTMSDPLDSKYMHWLRPFALSRHRIGLVPGLAVEVGDVALRKGEIGCLLVSWAALMQLADEFWVLPSIDGRPTSSAVSLLQSSWTALHPSRPLEHFAWKDVRVPKAIDRDSWALTDRESGGSA